MPYVLKDEDYLTLWQYFQDKATDIKGAMFNTITWVIGFAAALLGVIFVNLVDFDPKNAAIPLSLLVIWASVAGLAICFYAFFTLGESAKHIKSNWTYADKCLDEIATLGLIVSSNAGAGNKRAIPIWCQLGIVVALFFLAFFLVLLWGISTS